MKIEGKLKNGRWLVIMKRNEIAKLNGYDSDTRLTPAIEVGQLYNISSKWNLIKLMRNRKKNLRTIGKEIQDISDAIN